MRNKSSTALRALIDGLSIKKEKDVSKIHLNGKNRSTLTVIVEPSLRINSNSQITIICCLSSNLLDLEERNECLDGLWLWEKARKIRIQN